MADLNTPPEFVPDLLKESETAVAPPEATAAKPPRRPRKHRDSDLLGISWLHGSLHIAVFRRQKMIGSWSSPTSIRTFEEFTPALDEALAATEFAGTDVFLLLEHEKFLHQTEMAPPFSEAAASTFLLSRISRFEKDKERVLWVSQRTVSVRQESSYILHILPASFYDELNKLLLVRRLDLTRILPLAVPLQRELDKFPITKDTPVLMAAVAGDATLVVVAKVNGPLLFARTILASWTGDPAKIGVEVNRSLLYAKQQFSTSVERLWILSGGNKTIAEIKSKCGSDKQITVLPSTAIDFLQTVAKLSPRHPVNLVASQMRRKWRQRTLRSLLLASCWIGLTFLAFNMWTREQTWSSDHERFVSLDSHAATLRSSHEHLSQRNNAVEHERLFVRQAIDDRLPPVANRFLAYTASVLPKEIRLTDFQVKYDSASSAWSFHLDGVVEADEETGRETVAGFQRQLAQSPLRAGISTVGKATLTAAVGGPGVAGANANHPEIQRFSVDGGLFEK